MPGTAGELLSKDMVQGALGQSDTRQEKGVEGTVSHWKHRGQVAGLVLEGGQGSHQSEEEGWCIPRKNGDYRYQGKGMAW